jgi:hypothetical protein
MDDAGGKVGYRRNIPQRRRKILRARWSMSLRKLLAFLDCGMLQLIASERFRVDQAIPRDRETLYGMIRESEI